MIDALKTVGDEYKAAGKIKDYKLVNNVTNGVIKEAQDAGILVVSFDASSPRPRS